MTAEPLPPLVRYVGSNPKDRAMFLPDKVINFLKEADFGPLYVYPPKGERHPTLDQLTDGDVADRLFFLNQEIEGSPNATYGIASTDIVNTLVRIYLEEKGLNWKSKDVIPEDHLLNKYFGNEIREHLVETGGRIGRFPGSFTEDLSPLTSPGNKERNEFIDIFDPENASRVQLEQYQVYFAHVRHYNDAHIHSESRDKLLVPYIDIACRLVGGGCEDNLDPIYNANPLLYIRALLDNLQQDLTKSLQLAPLIKARLKREERKRGPSVKFAGKM